MKRSLGILCTIMWAVFALGQANGKLQIHFMDAAQADAAILVSPGGEVVLFDNGVSGQCDKPISYLQQLGVTKIDYNIISHYHADHIGCSAKLLEEFPLQADAFDRGQKKAGGKLFNEYVKAVGKHRKAALPGMKVVLDAATPNPVEIVFVAENGNGVKTKNENDLSLVAVIHYGQFDAEIGGDLSGYKQGSYDDVETSVAPLVGQVEVYKVHHHCSQYSTNDTWLSTIKPKVAVVSVGDGNSYRHPKAKCLDRLHAAAIPTYWTEDGNGARPTAGKDIVGGNIVVEVAPSAATFTVTYQGTFVDTYPLWGASEVAQTGMPQFAWSKLSSVYHYASCKYVDNISPANLERGNQPPPNKTLHKDCPR
jgi:beta-lactamase superfamily II metal-dependent hydrolase